MGRFDKTVSGEWVGHIECALRLLMANVGCEKGGWPVEPVCMNLASSRGTFSRLVSAHL